MEWLAHDPAALDGLAAELLSWAGPRRVFAFTGPVGAGKTTFTQALCRRLGVKEAVTSPTFALVNEYAGADGPIFHLDLYRLKDIDEALDMGIEEYLFSGVYCFVEWPEVIDALLPPEAVKIEIVPLSDGSRKLLFL